MYKDVISDIQGVELRPVANPYTHLAFSLISLRRIDNGIRRSDQLWRRWESNRLGLVVIFDVWAVIRVEDRYQISQLGRDWVRATFQAKAEEV